MIFSEDVSKYNKIDQLLEKNIDFETELICLPYLVGERYPVADSKIRGSYFGLNPSTSLTDLVISAL